MNHPMQAALMSCLLTVPLNAMETNNNETELHKAAFHGDVRRVAQLLKSHANPNTQTSLGKTPAHKCIYADPLQSVDILRLLKEAGANLDLQDSYGKTVLHEAICNEKWHVAQIIISLGANETMQDHNGHTPSHLCAIIESPQLSQKYLLDPKSLTPEYLAQFQNKKQVTFK